MVTVDNDVVAEPRRTALVDVGHAIVAVCLVKAVLQVVIRVIRRLHDGIVDARFVNGDPTDEVIVLFKKSAISLLRQFRFRCRGFFPLRIGYIRSRRRYLHHQSGQFVKGSCAVLGVKILMQEDSAANERRYAQQADQSNADDFSFFHTTSSLRQAVKRPAPQKCPRRAWWSSADRAWYPSGSGSQKVPASRRI
mgnify:CR=1 FL=1